MSRQDARTLGEACAAEDPYLTLEIGADTLSAHLAQSEPGRFHYALETDGRLAGALVVRWPWLQGAFIDMLSVLPPWRRRGLGEKAVTWVAAVSQYSNANLWATVSAFNSPARAFWKAQEFVETAELDDLIVTGQMEILLRRRLS